MNAYILRRVLLAIPTLFGVTLIVFSITRLLPGDVVNQITGENVASEAVKEDIRQALGLNRPLHVQYLSWLGGTLKGDFGRSLISDRPITEDLQRRLPVSAELGLMAMTMGLLVALPIGILSAVHQDSLFDQLARGLAVLALSVPAFWVGTLVVVLPSLAWNWAPPLEYHSLRTDPISNLYILFFPAAILGLALTGTTMRLTRAMMLEVLRQDYIRTARAKGLGERVVILRHGLRNASIPVVTVIGLQIPLLAGGTVVLETIFGIPGVGRQLFLAIQQRDYPVIQSINLVVAVVIVGSNIVVDVLYSYLDPRVGQR